MIFTVSKDQESSTQHPMSEENEPKSSSPKGIRISEISVTPSVLSLPNSQHDEKPQSAAALSSNNEQSRVYAYTLGGVASIGGFIFGYESGQISGFLQMTDFTSRFSENGTSFTPLRSGTVVSMLSAGTFVGCLLSAPLSDRFGRRPMISYTAFFYIIGIIIEVTSSYDWVQFAMGRFVSGLAVGSFSCVVPMYIVESVPRDIRGNAICLYQLVITAGIWGVDLINFGTERPPLTSAQWRIPNGLGALWGLTLGVLIWIFPESPRWVFRKGRVVEARNTIARLHGLEPDSGLINQEMLEIQEKLDEEKASKNESWSEIFTAPRMAYRTILGMVLQAGTQWTGPNFFFYFGTTVFASTGVTNPYLTSLIIATVNMVATILGLVFVVPYINRRPALIYGAVAMVICLLVYSLVGHFCLSTSVSADTAHPNETAGVIMILFTCLFITAFATTWGALIWSLTSEMYPAKYRATCIALTTAASWAATFGISFGSSFAVAKIGWLYGLVFAGCSAFLAGVVWLFLVEPKGRGLEEIDSMYVSKVNPRESRKWNKVVYSA